MLEGLQFFISQFRVRSVLVSSFLFLQFFGRVPGWLARCKFPSNIRLRRAGVELTEKNKNIIEGQKGCSFGLDSAPDENWTWYLKEHALSIVQPYCIKWGVRAYN
jgi:hypothetical protein